MDSKTWNLKYGKVNGNLAVDMRYTGNAVPKREPVYAPPLRREIQRDETSTKVRTVPAKKKRGGISMSTMLFFAVSMFLVISLISEYTKLVSLSESTVSLREELSTLREENTILKTRYESEIDLREIEEYAINELGMVMPSADRVVYIDLSEPDKIVLGSSEGTEAEDVSEEREPGLLEKIIEYFR